MHNPEYQATNNFVQVHFDDRFTPITEQPKLADLIQLKINKKEYFYGVELSARSSNTLDYQNFAVLPLFTSLVWFGGEYCAVNPIVEVDAVRFGQSMLNKTVVMPHFTCFRATPDRLNSFLSLDFGNILALRGDDVDDRQHYLHASDLVTDIRKIRGDTISIGVGGYPQGHPQSESMEEDIKYLAKKVNSGADFIITQICFDARTVMEFIGNCRKNGITVPIIVGVYVPENYRILIRMLEITKVTIEPEKLREYRRFKNNPTEFKHHAINVAENYITEVFNSDLGIFGIQFFSMNQFESIEKLVNNVILKFNSKS